MHGGQRRPVHGHRQQGVAAVQHTWSGVPAVNPSTDVPRIWVAPARGRAERMMLARLAPGDFAFPIYGPATGSDTQVSVT